MSLKTKPFLIFIFMATTSVLFTDCTKDRLVSEPDKQQENIPMSTNIQNDGTTTTSICFKAIAVISSCHGENIEFTGTIENKVNTTVDENGNTHFTRHFTVNGLTGKGTMSTSLVPATGPVCSRTSATYTGTEYEVIGGAEMFAMHFGPGGSNTLAGSNIFIHQGTLVFVNKATGERVVARHVIRKTPGTGVATNTWLCGGN